MSAAMHWDIPYFSAVLNPALLAQLKEASSQKTHLVFPDANSRTKASTIVSHYRNLPLPVGSVVRHKGKLVASPELVFVELANELGFHRAVLLGMQLCASSPARNAPLTSTQKLSSFVNDCKGLNGYKAASCAVQYLADNSWSIMESLLYMLLTLPNQHGGFGLKGAQLNHDLFLKEKGTWQKTNRVTVDLYWKEARLAVEYDSFEFHNSANSWMKDARRLATLERNGFKTFSINTAQMYNDAALTEAAYAIAQHLGKRIRIRSSNFTKQKTLLRSLLPHKDSGLSESMTSQE